MRLTKSRHFEEAGYPEDWRAEKLDGVFVIPETDRARSRACPDPTVVVALEMRPPRGMLQTCP